MKTRRKMWKRKTRRGRGRRRQKAGSVDAFKQKYDSDKSGLVKIGSGGAGTVYLDPQQPSVVFKVGIREDTCREWGKEQTIYQQLSKTPIDTPLVKLLKMNDFKTYGGKCVLELSRVVNPIDPNADYTIQVLMGYDEMDYKEPARGRLMGALTLANMNVIPKAQLLEYSKQLGQAVGRLHYIAKNDGYDMEVFAGTEGGRTVLYIGDFDLSDMITTYGPAQIKRMAWALAAVQYFPTTEQQVLYIPFKAAYLEAATSSGQQAAAEAVLAEYEEYHS